jgi:hypothetical protein
MKDTNSLFVFVFVFIHTFFRLRNNYGSGLKQHTSLIWDSSFDSCWWLCTLLGSLRVKVLENFPVPLSIEGLLGLHLYSPPSPWAATVHS